MNQKPCREVRGRGSPHAHSPAPSRHQGEQSQASCSPGGRPEAEGARPITLDYACGTAGDKWGQSHSHCSAARVYRGQHVPVRSNKDPTPQRAARDTGHPRTSSWAVLLRRTAPWPTVQLLTSHDPCVPQGHSSPFSGTSTFRSLRPSLQMGPSSHCLALQRARWSPMASRQTRKMCASQTPWQGHCADGCVLSLCAPVLTWGPMWAWILTYRWASPPLLVLSAGRPATTTSEVRRCEATRLTPRLPEAVGGARPGQARTSCACSSQLRQSTAEL